MSSPVAAIAYARQHRERFQEELKALLRIPSVSTSPERSAEMMEAAEWVAEQLRELSFERVQVLPTARHPVVYGENLRAGADAPTVLFYGHYDVQPAEPLELWTSGPFDPAVRGENLYARGASDMKGQVVAFLKAVESWIKSAGRLPLNLKCMIEGEEEIGSTSLPEFMRANRKLLACDYCLNGDGGILAPDAPAITYALRGLAYFEIRLQGPSQDLHSGLFGGAVENPANVLARLIAGMHDEHGRITLPGFYERVRPLAPDERAALARLPQPDAWWIAKTGAPALGGEAGYTAIERASARPTLDVNGLSSGFTGAGSKTVLPSKAMAKISLRLVPDQEFKMVRASMEAYLKQQVPPTVSWELLELAGSNAPMIERDSKAVRAARRALEAVWKKEPLFTRCGGTVPVVSQIKELLGVDSLLLGFELPDDNLHAPNEKIHLPTYERGVETYIYFLHYASISE